MAEQDPTTGAELVTCGAMKLKRLSPSDMVAMANFVRRGYGRAAQACAKAAGLSPEKTFAALLEAERLHIGRSDLIAFILTVEGQREAIRLAMQRTLGHDVSDTELDAAGIPVDQMLEIASVLGSFRVAKAEGNPANPRDGGSQTGTGTSSPTPSA